VSAEPDAGPDEMCEAAREDREPVRHEQFADVKPAEVCSEEPAGTCQNAPPPEPIAAEAVFVGKQEAKRGLDIEPSSPVVLFAGHLSYEAGADILLEAIVTICCSGDREALFLFAGEGAMRRELQERASRAGLERRCRFLRDVPATDFDRVLRACDFVVIPGRVPQGEDLARMAVAKGKPVLTTHQAAIGGVIVHGRNGLITYDNPGSLVWGIRELLGPVYANLRCKVAETAQRSVV
jgi:glycosyltransferase involved in cell wall biosynthesis